MTTNYGRLLSPVVGGQYCREFILRCVPRCLTGLKKSRLYDLFRRGGLRGYRDGAMVRFYRAALLAYMKERENAPASPPPEICPRRRKKPPTPPGVRFKFL